MPEIDQQSFSTVLSEFKSEQPLQPEPDFFLGVRRSALIETVLFLSILVLLSVFTGDGTRYINAPVHPFWAIVLIVTVQYGVKEGLAAAMLAALFLLAGNMPEQLMSESFYEYIARVSFLPFLWGVAALVLGGVRARQISEKNDLAERLDKTEQASAAIAQGYTSLKESKEQLERRLSEERISLLTIYGHARSLSVLDYAQAMEGFETLIRAALNPVKFSIFLWGDQGLRLERACGWENESYARHFAPHSALAHNIIRKKQTLSVTHARDEKYLAEEGLIAGPIRDEKTGKVYGMIKIEEAGFADFDARSCEMFRIICAWMAQTLTNIEKYQQTAAKLVEEKRCRDMALLPGFAVPQMDQPVAAYHAA